MNDPVKPNFGGSSLQNHGPALPMTSMGPDCHIELIYPPVNKCVLVVRRDETVSGWDLTTLPARSTSVSCGGDSMTGTPNYSGPLIDGRRWGTLEITSVHHANTEVHTEYTYSGDTYYDNFANGAYDATAPAEPNGDVLIVLTKEPRLQVRMKADGSFVLELSPEGVAAMNANNADA